MGTEMRHGRNDSKNKGMGTKIRLRRQIRITISNVNGKKKKEMWEENNVNKYEATAD